MECPFYPSPNFTPGRKGKINSIILHRTYGNIEKTINWCLNPHSLESFHYIVGRTGTIIQLVSCQNVAWHAGWVTNPNVAAHFKSNPNDFSIGIACEDCGAGKNSNTFFSKDQTRALIKLINALKHSFRIKLTPDHLVSHSSLDPDRNPLDPGPYIDWETVLRFVIDLKFSDHDDLLIRKKTADSEPGTENVITPADNTNSHVMEALITKVFHGLLNRDPNASELDYYHHSKLDLAQITRRVVSTEEFRKKQLDQDKSKLRLMTFLS